MRLRLEEQLLDENQLPNGLGLDDRGRTWWIDFTWYIWTGAGWKQAIATRDRP